MLIQLRKLIERNVRKQTEDLKLQTETFRFDLLDLISAVISENC